MNVGSLFSGIGGLDHGLARAGFQHAFFCESDEWRRTVLAHHWPGVPIYEDVREVASWSRGRRPGHLATDGARAEPEWDGFAVSVEPAPPDLLCGGFPCQDLSVAGQRRGLAGDRSGLFFEFARIIDLVRPGWVLVENVPGLLSSNGGRDFGIVLGTLADLGYGLAWRVLDSRFFGVPQRRRRVFILGALADGDPRAATQRAGQILAVGTRCPGHPATRGEAGEGAPYASAIGAHGSSVAGPLRTFTGGHKQDLDGNGAYVTDVRAYHFRTRDGGSCFEETDVNVSRASVGGSGGAKLALHTQTGVRRLTPLECERLQALPDNWTAHGPDSRRYAALGDAVTSTVAEWIGRRLMKVGA